MKQLITSILFVAAVLASCSSPEVSSPDGRLHLKLTVDEAGSIFYQVDVDGSPFIAPSRLGLVASNAELASGFVIEDIEHGAVDSVWHQPWGENKELTDRHNSMSVTMANGEGVQLTLSFKLFDDGLGFRYDYDVPGVDSLFVTDELTQFAIVGDGMSWSIPASFETYELEYREMPLSTVGDANTPMTFKTEGGLYASLHEAALTDYPEMTLRRDSTGVLKADLAPWPDGVKARYAGGHCLSPWRTVQVADEAVGLINSPLILNLNEPCALATTDWVRPMRYVGVWWGMHLGIETWQDDERHGATTANAKKYIDFAADNGIEGVVFEGWNRGWESWGGRQSFDFTAPYDDFDMGEVVRYAKERGVQVIGHHETGGNVPNYERQLDRAYAWCDSLGIRYVKTGYAGGMPGGQFHHGQYGVRHYRRVVETAARYHVSLDVHEPIKDTGIRRTWPNMMTREGARGMEWNAWSKGNSPEHELILPFTRLLAGPMDYTPGAMLSMQPEVYRSERPNSASIGTRAYQMALFVIFESGLQMMADNPTLYYRNDECSRFLTQVPQTWDETIALKAKVGEYVIVAKRKGEKWYIGGMTNNQQKERTFDIALDFLPEGKACKITSFEDGINANRQAMDYRKKEQTLKKGDILHVRMARNGGFAAVIE